MKPPTAAIPYAKDSGQEKKSKEISQYFSHGHTSPWLEP